MSAAVSLPVRAPLHDDVGPDFTLHPTKPLDELRCPRCGGADLQERTSDSELVDCKSAACRAELYRLPGDLEDLEQPACSRCGRTSEYVLIREVRLAADVVGLRDDEPDGEGETVAIALNSTENEVDNLCDWVECACGTRLPFDYWEWGD